MKYRHCLRAALLATSAIVVAYANPALAQSRDFDVPAQSAASGIAAFAEQADIQILVMEADTRGRLTHAVEGSMPTALALQTLLAGSGLKVIADDGRTITLSASDPQSGSAAGDGADQGTVAALIVTAQKREEQIQDVPIAISAFTEKSLEEQKIEGGFDLLKAIPNVTFSKNNFTSYNFSIRGIGTKAVSATTDPGVAVSFNNIALLQNRLFEQEYFDVERVEVLRGPQGTLYGRNATAGVINVISAKPNLQEFDGWIKGEVGNYHTKRLSAMVNVPLVEDKLGIRLAGSLTDRQGYDFNEGTHHAVNGRDLWSGRVTVAFKPTDSIRANLVWERFNEDDNRSRTGKQLCHHDAGPTSIGSGQVSPTPDFGSVNYGEMRRALFSQGCLPGSLYDDSAFGTPNGLALPFVFAMATLQEFVYPLNFPDPPHGLLQLVDPYSTLVNDPAVCAPNAAPCHVPGQQSRDLRVISSFRDPVYRAKADVVEFNLDWDITDALTFSSQTAYNKDSTYSFQDFNRFNTVPIFNDTSNFSNLSTSPEAYQPLAPGGIFCDPQLGCSKSLAGFDIAQAKGEQFTQELRLQSHFDGAVNFSVGANYTRFKTLVDYYVFYNLITAFSMIAPFNGPQYYPGGYANIYHCYNSLTGATDVPLGTPGSACPYIDPNPIESINGEGHNYFRSKNPYKLKSWASFGELYWQMTPELKLTAGLRYTDDRKVFIPVPTQILLAEGILAGGDVNRGYPEDPPIKQHWGEWTGRLGVDWKPDLSFTDQTLLYAFYSHGYKAGGANPPTPGFTKSTLNEELSVLFGFPVDIAALYGILPEVGERFNRPMLELGSVDYGPTFKPEFVNAFELGSKNTLLNGGLTFNTTAFFYEYKDYQVSQIKNRTAVNENFDAKAWGLELEAMFAPSRNLQFVANLGYLDTKIADGATSLDIMNRTQGNDNYVVVKPWVQLPSNCVAPRAVVERWLNVDAISGNIPSFWEFCGGNNSYIELLPALFYSNTGQGFPIDPSTNLPYDPANYPEIHGGAGIYADLGGNELPNAPHWTMNVGGQWGHDILDGSWRMTVRGDAYWQSQSWARVYNSDPYDKLHGWYNVNLSVWLEKPDDDLKIELYAKNILDKTPITDAFLNSDDTALTTNVFVLDPRLIGLSIKKGF